MQLIERLKEQQDPKLCTKSTCVNTIDSELKTIAKKTGKSVEKLRADLLIQGGRKLNGR